MRSLDARAIENIASAPATLNDRRAGAATALAILIAFLLTIPFAHARLEAVPAFLPTVVGAGIVALVLTAVLLYVQYRIERDLRLALLAIAYGYASVTQLLYVLTFPGSFAPNGLADAGPQTAAWSFVASQLGFAAFLIAEGLASRRGWRVSRNGIRAMGWGTAALTIALAFGLTIGHDYLPPLTRGNAYEPLWTDIVAPFMAAVTLLALAIVSHGLRTVTDVWLGVVLLARFTAVISAGELATARFSAGWYAARIEELIAAVVVLAIFLVKINDLMIRLAVRNRSTAEALAVGEARYASLANVVPQLIWTANPQGDFEYVNDRWVAYTGLDLNATRDGGWRRVVHVDHQHAIRDQWQHSLRTGESFAGEYRLCEHATGRHHWFLINATPVRAPGGRILAWIGTCTDIDATKRLEEREAFLARAGDRLGASLDVVATIAGMKSLVIPRLADRMWVVLVEDGRYALAGFGSADIAEELAARPWIGTPLDPALHDAVSHVLDDGGPAVLDKPNRFTDPWLGELPAGCTMLVPLVSGDAAIGVLGLVCAASRPYDIDDVGLAREFAHRAALSLDHARLYERERTTADALQRAMLPAQLPHVPDVRFSASYSAASESQRVGGDFYDAFELPDGRVALTIGDVTGHGLEAAVIMGEIRQALRAAAFEMVEPSAILDRASRLLLASGREEVFVTAIFAVLDPITGRLAYASAGHPAPLVDDGTELRRLLTAGLPIGLREGQGVDFALRLHAPCTLVLFTDGLMEFARDLAEGERRIENAIRALAREDIDHLAAALMHAVLGDDEPTDDIAILTATIERFAEPLPGEEREWRFASDDGRTSAMIRREVGALFGRWTGRPDGRFASELAFGELIANVVRHAPGPVRIVASCDPSGAATLTVEDTGAGFAPGTGRIDLYAEGGRGLRLVRGVSDGMEITRMPQGGTRISATFLPRRIALAHSA